MALPNFLIIGPPRSGTTWMYEAFAAHPDVYMSPKKEIKFFYAPNYARGLDWYERFFAAAGNARWRGEATPNYLDSEESPVLIHRHLPDAHLFCCLRDPIDRLLSHYFHRLNLEKWDLQIDVDQALADPPTKLTEPGFYGRHLSRYLEFFPQERLHILFFDDLRVDAGQFAREMYGRLGIDTSFLPPGVTAAVNPRKTIKPSGTVRRKVYEQLHLLARASYQRLAATLPPSSVETVRRALPIRRLFDMLREEQPKAKLTLDTHRRLAELYRNDVGVVQRLTGRRLDHWLEYKE